MWTRTVLAAWQPECVMCCQDSASGEKSGIVRPLHDSQMAPRSCTGARDEALACDRVGAAYHSLRVMLHIRMFSEAETSSRKGQRLPSSTRDGELEACFLPWQER